MPMKLYLHMFACACVMCVRMCVCACVMCVCMCDVCDVCVHVVMCL